MRLFPPAGPSPSNLRTSEKRCYRTWLAHTARDLWWLLCLLLPFVTTFGLTALIYYGNQRGFDSLAMPFRMLVTCLCFVSGPVSFALMMYGLGLPANRYEVAASALVAVFAVLFNVKSIQDSGMGPLPERGGQPGS